MFASERAGSPNAEVTLAVFCNWEKHRSVGFAEELRTLLCERMPVEVNHLEQSHWDRRNGVRPQRDPDWHSSTCMCLTAKGY
eukprot:3332137-Amphidinium_carterae.1